MSFFHSVKDAFEGLVHEGQHVLSEIQGGSSEQTQTNAVESTEAQDQVHDIIHHRFESFAKPRHGNQVKWHVDGCSYFWAVSEALEKAQESIWILDWWLSPELYLRRPPAKNEQYRLDRMLRNAAERGVKVNVIVYKEVTQVLTGRF
jgi:phospholipase D1/2